MFHRKRKSNEPRRHRGRAATVACLTLLASALGAIDAGSAAALGEQCSGNNVSGHVGFLQAGAQAAWTGVKESGFNLSKDPAACSGTQGSKGKPKVSYTPLGSGPVLNEWGAFDAVFHEKSTRFLGLEEPPSGPVEEEGTQLASIKKAIGSDLVVVPVAQTAIAIVANAPALPAHSPCNVGQVTQFDLAGVFAGTLTNWRQLATASDSEPGGDCDQAITRIVREEGSGTTYQFKHYLDQLEPEALECTGEALQTWAQLQPSTAAGGPNTTWPRKADCGEGEGPVTTVATVGEGAAGPLDYVREHPGTITYGDLPEAMARASEQVTRVYNGALFAEPYDTGSEAEANCAAAEYPLPPGVAEGLNVDWSQVHGSDPAIGESKEGAYPICTLTWVLAPATPAAVFGKKAGTTIRDYLAYTIAEGGGQKDLQHNWYLDLPGEVAEAASVAVAQIGGEGEEEEESEEEGARILCKAPPTLESEDLVCPPGEAYAGVVTGTLVSGSTAYFEAFGGPVSGVVKCNEAEFGGLFKQDGTSAVEGGVFGIEFFGAGEGGRCTASLEPKAGSNVAVRFDNPPYGVSKFVYLGALAPQAAFVLAKAGLLAPELRLEDPKVGFKCIYKPFLVGGQVVNGSPTILVLNGKWNYSSGGGKEECPTALSQTSELSLVGAESEPLYVSGK